MSVLALDQMLEGIVKVCVLTLAASFSPLPVEMQQGIQTFIVLILIFSVLMFYAAYKLPQKSLHEKTSSSTLFFKLKIFVSQWAGHLEVLKDYRIFCLGLSFFTLNDGLPGIWNMGRAKGFGARTSFLDYYFSDGCLKSCHHFSFNPRKLWGLRGYRFFNI
ncbi:MAG: hypothetical protein CM1200mP16_15290 [Nitrospina sp.]|nr:MAG: hypothetical protein CM1200mP16_15290 [Nitrospina sp.]